jgi:hypothetical protein
MILVMAVIVGGTFVPPVTAQPLQQLFIEMYDSETSNALQTNTVIEGKSYDIAIGTLEDIGFVVNVTISVSCEPGQFVTSNETPFITIKAPSWNSYPTLVINASKPGYVSVEQVFTVIKGVLSMSLDSRVKEKDEFQVTVRDQENQPVENALVFIDPNGAPGITNVQGIVYLAAPEVTQDRNIAVKTTKDGYVNASAVILVESVATFPVIGSEMVMQLAPILFAVVAVIFAVLYVRWRKRTHHDSASPQTKPGTPPPEAPMNPTSTRKQPMSPDPASLRVSERGPATFPSSTSKVEEIRIPLQEKRKETTVLSMEPPQETVTPHQKKDENEWFKGQEYMRHKLDEMTGTIDKKSEGKWFEGERNIESKVDEALKKQSKRKKVEQQEIR